MTDSRTSDHLLVHFIERSFDFYEPYRRTSMNRTSCSVLCLHLSFIKCTFSISSFYCILWDLNVWLLLVSSCNNLLHILLKNTHIKQIHSFILLPFKYSSVFSQTKHTTNVNPSKMTSQSIGTCLLQKTSVKKLFIPQNQKVFFFFF